MSAEVGSAICDSIHNSSRHTPSATQGSNSAVIYPSGESNTPGPVLRMPQVNETLPITLARITTSVTTTVFKWRVDFVALVACIGGDRGAACIGDELLALGAQRHVLASFLGQPLAIGRIENRLADHTPDYPRPEIIFAVKTLHPIDQLRPVKPRINHRRKLMANIIGHGVDGDEVVFLCVVVKLGAWIGVRDRHLDRLVIPALGEVNSLTQTRRSLARQPDDKIAVNH